MLALNIKEQTFDTGVVTLNYAQGPPCGPPLVLLHGGSTRWQSFEDIIPTLASKWHLYAPDLRGHGKSGRVPGCYRLLDYVADISTFLRHNLTSPTCLFGHSLGGIVSLLIAAQYPDLVRAVFVGDAPLTKDTFWVAINKGRSRVSAWHKLVGGTVPIDELIKVLQQVSPGVLGQGKSATYKAKKKDEDEDEAYLTWLATNLYHNDPDMLTALLEDFETTAANYEMSKVMPAIHCPIFLLQADPTLGALMTDTDVEQALTLLAHPQHVKLKGVGHPLHHTHKDLVLQLLTDFLDSLE